MQELLDQLADYDHDILIPSIQGYLERHDDQWQSLLDNLSGVVLDQLEGSHDSEDSIWVVFLHKTSAEEGQ